MVRVSGYVISIFDIYNIMDIMSTSCWPRSSPSRFRAALRSFLTQTISVSFVSLFKTVTIMGVNASSSNQERAAANPPHDAF